MGTGSGSLRMTVAPDADLDSLLSTLHTFEENR